MPQDLQLATFGMLTQLQNAPKDNDYLKSCCALVSTLTGVDEKIVASRRAYDVLGIVNMIQSEMERIGKLFQSLQTDHTSDEQAAGIDLNAETEVNKEQEYNLSAKSTEV